MHVPLGRDPRTDPGCTRLIISLEECLGIPQEELLRGEKTCGLVCLACCHCDLVPAWRQVNGLMDYVHTEISCCAKAGNL